MSPTAGSKQAAGQRRLEHLGRGAFLRRPGSGGSRVRRSRRAAGRGARLLRYLLGVRRPLGGARPPGTVDEARGGRDRCQFYFHRGVNAFFESIGYQSGISADYSEEKIEG